MPETWPDQRIYIGKIQHIGCHNLIQDILKDKPEMSLHFPLGRLIEQLQEENHVLAFKEDTSIPHIAWAFRKAIGLRIFVRFVLKSQRNLDRFNNDFLINAQSALRSSLELVKEFGKKVENPMQPTSDQYRSVEEMRQARSQVGLGQEGPLMARTCASAVGLENQYLATSLDSHSSVAR